MVRRSIVGYFGFGKTRNNVLIILEGPNGCGKSALAKQLAKALDRPVFKFPMPVFHFEVIANAIREIPKACILDRHPMISDQVYSKIMFNEAPIDFEPQRLKDHRIIYVRCPLATAIKNHRYIENDPFYRHEIEIFALYDVVMSFIPHIKFNWVNDSVEELIERLKAKTI